MNKKPLSNPLRRRKPAVQVELDLPPPPGTPGSPEVVELEPQWWQTKWFVGLLAGAAARHTTPEAAMDLEGALARLPDGAREIFVLHDVEGYRHEEIAEMLGLATGTSKSQLHRARMALREWLD